MRTTAALAAALALGAARAGPVFLPQAASSVAAAPAVVPAPTAAAPSRWFQPDRDGAQMVSVGSGLSFHKPMYALPATWSALHHGRGTEVIFQISLKHSLLGLPWYIAYSQKSFWDAYDSGHSKPFRESDYNPEMFYRLVPRGEHWRQLGADIGIEHESNGQGLPGSRSWNRIYLAPFEHDGGHLVYWKWWWRLPENEGRPRTDPQRDDNPDIGSFYGYSELTYKQRLFAGRHMLSLMGRLNPVTHRGALSLQYTIPNDLADPTFFWMFSFWQGYGESLADYNHSITRLGLGIAFVR